MPANSYKVGPGTLKLGETGTATDFSCQFSDIALVPDKDSEDAIKVLCGDEIAGDVTYTWSLTGNLVQDLADTGITTYTLANAGKTVPFEFSPLTTGPSFTGKVQIDPTKIGGEVGKTATSEFEFAVVGTPQRVPAPAAP